MVELKLGQAFPNKVQFLDEKKNLIEIDIEYEWKPSICTKCKQLGHEHNSCRKGKPKIIKRSTTQVWRPVKKNTIPEASAVAPQVIQEKAGVQEEEGQQPTVGMITPATLKPGFQQGTISPVRPVRTKQGPEDVKYNAQYIHMSILNKQAQARFFHTIVYAFNGITERESLWLNLKRLAGSIQGPWSVGGDFNCVLNVNERLRGSVSMAESAPFQDCLDSCQLMDIKASGAFFTWNNKQPPETRKYSRLDRYCLESNCGWDQDVQGCKEIKLLKLELKQLNKDSFSDIEHKADLAETKLLHIQQQIMSRPGDSVLIQQEVEAHKDYQGLYLAKMEFLKQKAKAHWLKEGDSNSSYFHSLIKARRNKNFIHHIADHKGVIHKEETGIQQAFLNYYRMMLLGTKSNTKKVRVGIVRTGKICTDQHSQMLMSPCTPEEVKNIIFQIPNDKAPGPDGYSSKFFKDSWDIIRHDVTEAVMDFFQSGCLLKQLNATLILCSRLAKVLPDLISPNQGGFIKERSIIENILICQDLVRLYERNAVSPRCLFKMDLQKAYDTIEWAFLDDMLQALNFPEQFREWIMQCVTTTTYSLNLNGNVFGFFKGQRGLRQGDPLSPLLFTICMEYLSRLLAYTTEGSSFKYHPLCKPLKLTHLMFADDLLLFCKGEAQSIMIILRTFSTFSKSSGLNMSKGKSNAYFSGVPDALKTISSKFAYNQRTLNNQKGHEYTIAKGYELIRLKKPEVSWVSQVWNRWSIPKHSFLVWIHQHNGLNTKDKMHKIGVSPDFACCICDRDREVNEHVFFKCQYSRRIITEIEKWMGIRILYQDLQEWRNTRKGSQLRRGLINSVLNACIYSIWLQRNRSRVEMRFFDQIVARQIITEMKKRLQNMIIFPVKDKDKRWIQGLLDLN
ncbi:uncharacterized protein LOC141649174 [Silene latifolia]|uniref:uncharacterized protein LOC141649174 n=1 Tax=Silene latifolia TaxID=37657 RepID=UPI003D77F3AC